MKNVLSILISILVLSGCLSLNTYVDPNYPHASYEDVRPTPQKYDVQTVVEFQRSGDPKERATEVVREHVERTLRATGIINPTHEASNIFIKVTVNNILKPGAKSGAAASGFLTGLTLGAVGTLATDYYEITIVYEDNQGTAITNNYKHALHTTIGNKSAPFPDVEPTSISDGFATIIEQVLLNFVIDMQNDNLLTHNPRTGQLVKMPPTESPDIVSDSVSGERVSAIEYYGEAEEEVNTKSYDKNLWAKALVEAEGDKEKQKGIYIKLRSSQLASQSKALKTKPNDSPDAAINISGLYVSQITSTNSKYFKKKYRKLVVMLKQEGNNITGSNSTYNVEIWGTLEGDTISFDMTAHLMNDFQATRGKWEVNADGTGLKGTWTIPGKEGSGKWNLTKIQ